ncbi:hypothetical protein OG462_41565 [Streptomyces sp. NBC_01077]|uniref:hypothetical protein n=1 Tax=Streptomyces sp. NBC_01077 TaxID=2903746 RepID=UPI00386C32C5|nr:hypothetical protein OG462_41565 [Streptomyces sp. NBC_01077]
MDAMRRVSASWRDRARPVNFRAHTSVRRVLVANAARGERAPRAIWLSSWGTMLSALAAAIGLLFTGTVAWFSVSTARQQSAQSLRAQATRVGFWEEPAPDEHIMTVLENRSLDPVTDVEVLFEPVLPFDPHPGYISIRFSYMPPCTRFTFPEGSFDKALKHLETSPFTKAPPAGGTPAAVIQFYDANGIHWVRNDTSLRQGTIEPDWRSAEGHPEDLDVNITRQAAQHCA